MSFVNRVFAIIMLPLSILILLDFADIFSLDIGMNKVLAGATLMILLQVFSIIMLGISQKKLRFMNLITFIILIAPAVLYLTEYFAEIEIIPYLPLVIAVMMLVEAIYALN